MPPPRIRRGSRRRARPGRSRTAPRRGAPSRSSARSRAGARALRSPVLLDPAESPLRVLAQERVVAVRVRLREGGIAGGVAESDQGIAAEGARGVPRDQQAGVGGGGGLGVPPGDV